MREGEAEAASDCRADARFAARVAEGTGYVPYTMLVVGLRRGGRTIGVLSVLDRRDGGAFGAGDVSRGEAFVDLALMADASGAGDDATAGDSPRCVRLTDRAAPAPPHPTRRPATAELDRPAPPPRAVRG